jgi:DNA-binding winged helix-turn-helix (wHTH) protein/TolB-like protein/Tfp pilus assembly protein PilF
VSNRNRHVRTFGKFSLDPEKRVLWCESRPVNLALNEFELICVLTENSGEVVTKAELLDLLWADAFVEESNLSRHVYVLRKMFKSFGVDDLIETVPRRGYRFAGEVHQPPSTNEEFTIERHAVSRTTIEEISDDAPASSISNLRYRFISLKVATIIAGVMLVGLLAGFTAWQGRFYSFAGSTAGVRSLAVMPFARIDHDQEAGQLGVGLADVLITRLSHLRGITVRPINAVTGVDDRDPVAAGKLLGVDALLMGTIYRSGDRTRVSVRIVKTYDGSTIWGGDFERLTTDGMRMQSDIALQVTNVLAQNLDSAEKNALAKSYTENSDAFHLYQRARFEWNKRNAQGATDAVSLFRTAIEKDPEFALAYAGLAEAMATINPDEAEIIAQRAIELDPDLAEAHASLGFIQLFTRRNWVGAENELVRSISLNPNYAPAHHWYAELLAIQGKNAAAKASMNRALEINPLSHNFLADMGQIYYFNREYKEAEHYCRRALELYPDFSFAHQYLSDIYLQTGEFEKAVDAELNAERIHGQFSIDSVARFRRFQAGLEEKRTAALSQGREEFLKRLLSGSTDNVFHYYDARRYAALGDKEMALDALESSVQSKAFHTAFVKVDPVFDAVRDDTRYKLVLQKMNLLDTYN